MGGLAWVTLATNDSYSLGALVLAHSLKQVGTNKHLVVLITPGVSSAMRERLSAVFNTVQEVNILDSKDERNLRLLKRPELGVTFTKLHCWRLTQFDKCVFLDADTLVLKNCDELFEREEFSAAPDVGWPDCFNSGVFVYRPSNETYEKLITFALEKGSFDGGDQGLLNLYFSDWSTKDINKHLPFIYNLCSTACYSYLPAFKQFGTDAKIIHFIGASKPWLQYFNTETKRVQSSDDFRHLQGVLQYWWDIFCNLIHPNLSPDMSGLAGAFAQLTLGAPRTAEQSALDDHLRRQGWEVGNIDYLGRDSFDNIWNKICETLSTVSSQPIQKLEEPTLPPIEPPHSEKVETEANKILPQQEISRSEQQQPQDLTVGVSVTSSTLQEIQTTPPELPKETPLTEPCTQCPLSPKVLPPTSLEIELKSTQPLPETEKPTLSDEALETSQKSSQSPETTTAFSQTTALVQETAQSPTVQLSQTVPETVPPPIQVTTTTPTEISNTECVSEPKSVPQEAPLSTENVSVAPSDATTQSTQTVVQPVSISESTQTSSVTTVVTAQLVPEPVPVTPESSQTIETSQPVLQESQTTVETLPPIQTNQPSEKTPDKDTQLLITTTEVPTPAISENVPATTTPEITQQVTDSSVQSVLEESPKLDPKIATSETPSQVTESTPPPQSLSTEPPISSATAQSTTPVVEKVPEVPQSQQETTKLSEPVPGTESGQPNIPETCERKEIEQKSDVTSAVSTTTEGGVIKSVVQEEPKEKVTLEPQSEVKCPLKPPSPTVPTAETTKGSGGGGKGKSGKEPESKEGAQSSVTSPTPPPRKGGGGGGGGGGGKKSKSKK